MYITILAIKDRGSRQELYLKLDPRLRPRGLVEDDKASIQIYSIQLDLASLGYYPLPFH